LRLYPPGKIPNDAGGQVLLPLGIEVGDLEAREFPAVLSGLAIQNELRDIGHRDRVTPGNPFDSNQLKEIAEEAIDGGRIVKVAD
jgi:hypothetical protein